MKRCRSNFPVLGQAAAPGAFASMNHDNSQRILMFRSSLLLLCLYFFVFIYVWALTFLLVLRVVTFLVFAFLFVGFAITLRCNTTIKYKSSKSIQIFQIYPRAMDFLSVKEPAALSTHRLASLARLQSVPGSVPTYTCSQPLIQIIGRTPLGI